MVEQTIGGLIRVVTVAFDSIISERNKDYTILNWACSLYPRSICVLFFVGLEWGSNTVLHNLSAGAAPETTPRRLNLKAIDPDPRHLIGRDGHLDQSDAYDLGDPFLEYRLGSFLKSDI